MFKCDHQILLAVAYFTPLLQSDLSLSKYIELGAPFVISLLLLGSTTHMIHALVLLNGQYRLKSLVCGFLKNSTRI